MSQVSVAVVGATGAVGREMIRTLERRKFPVKNIRFFASARSAGSTLSYLGEKIAVEELTPTCFDHQGIEIAQGLPLLAGIADRYAIIRSMTHGSNAHETASYMMQTGHEPGGGLVYPALRAIVPRFRRSE
mgnify:CR=1 FL=1